MTNRPLKPSRAGQPLAQFKVRSLTAAELKRAPRLDRDFFARDAVTVARELLGKLLVRREGRNLLAGRLVETEAYLGAADPAAHAYNGRTPRNAVLFGPPGHAYVYFIYGNHYCANVTCRPGGDAEGVLLRALEPVHGWEGMAEARGLELSAEPFIARLRLISSGPGRLSEALGITRDRDNAKDLTAPSSDLWFADDGWHTPGVLATPRIGIRKAIDEPLRFVIAGNPFVSGRRIS